MRGESPFGHATVEAVFLRLQQFLRIVTGRLPQLNNCPTNALPVSFGSTTIFVVCGVGQHVAHTKSASRCGVERLVLGAT